MAFEITIPRLGWSMEEGTFVRWLKQDGDIVKAGDAVFELEGEKAAQDIEAVDSGILRIPPTAPKPGTVVAVGAVVGYLVADGESIPVGSVTISTAAVPAVVKSLAAPTYPKAEVEVAGPEVEVARVAPAAAPSVRRLAREMGVKLAMVSGSGPSGNVRITVMTMMCESGP